MLGKNSNRRNFLKYFGITTAATLVTAPAIGMLTTESEIKKLNAEQRQFMNEYEKWMDEFIDVIRIQKLDPFNWENQKKMISLTHQAEEFKPRLNEYMKDPAFAFIYKTAIERMSREI